jgi:hypothetical protein
MLRLRSLALQSCTPLSLSSTATTASLAAATVRPTQRTATATSSVTSARWLSLHHVAVAAASSTSSSWNNTNIRRVPVTRLPNNTHSHSQHTRTNGMRASLPASVMHLLPAFNMAQRAFASSTSSSTTPSQSSTSPAPSKIVNK